MEQMSTTDAVCSDVDSDVECTNERPPHVEFVREHDPDIEFTELVPAAQSIAQQFERHAAEKEMENTVLVRTTLTKEQKLWLIGQCRESGNNVHIINRFKKKFDDEIASSTVSKYRKKTVADVQNEATRGRPKICPKSVEADLFAAFVKVRSAGTPVFAKVVASIARGMCERRFKASTDLDGSKGAKKFSTEWARTWMIANDIKIRRATGDRTTTDEEAVEASVGFFAKLKTIQLQFIVPRELTYNADEWFLSFGHDNKEWTWEYVGPSRRTKNVAIKKVKLGMTSTVLSAADGAVPLMQYIHEGTTERKFVDLGTDLGVLQCKRKDSHFQNAATWEELLNRFIIIVNLRREELTSTTGVDYTHRKALFLFDSAGQHTMEHTTKKLAEHNILCVQIPKKMTHVFQPADQFVIAGIKHSADGLWHDEVARLYRDNDIAEATKKMNETSVPVLRERKLKLVEEARKNLDPEAVKGSWALCGLNDGFFGEKFDGTSHIGNSRTIAQLTRDNMPDDAGDTAERKRGREENESGEAETPTVGAPEAPTEETTEKAKRGRPPLTEQQKRDREAKKANKKKVSKKEAEKAAQRAQDAQGCRDIRGLFGGK